MNWKENDVYTEESLQRAIRRATAAFYEGEEARCLSRWEFLVQQSRCIQCRWWVLQVALLILVWCLLKAADSTAYVQRSLGVAAPLFVLLALPELWKNRSCNAMEVEGAALYSLRQIYAARLTLFIGMDVLLLSSFFLAARWSGTVTVWELLVEFLLPCNVSCCLCFACLYSPRHVSQSFSLLLCGIWTVGWELLVLNDPFYLAISVPLWQAMLALSFAALGACVWQGQRKWKQTWEVKPLWN